MSAKIRLPTLCIAVGSRCNFSCRHCLFEVKKRGINLTSEEISLLQSTVKKYSPRVLSITGGEPTLYLPDICKVISAHPIPDKLKVILATNGSFAICVHAAKVTLSSIPHLGHVQLSYDRFHAEFLPRQNIENLHAACVEMGISFSVLVAIQSPLDLAQVGELKTIGDFKIGVQPICDMGEARKNTLAFCQPVFNKKVFSKTCPGRSQISYLCGKGFSICCANLLFNDVYAQSFHNTIEEHMRSDFYKMMTTMPFGKIIDKAGVSRKNMLPQYSAECSLCEYIFSNMQFRNKVGKGGSHAQSR